MSYARHLCAGCGKEARSSEAQLVCASCDRHVPLGKVYAYQAHMDRIRHIGKRMWSLEKAGLQDGGAYRKHEAERERAAADAHEAWRAVVAAARRA